MRKIIKRRKKKMSDTETYITIDNLVGKYKGTFGIVHAIDKVSLKVKKGEIVGIAGESGCGKSTLVELITGLPKSLLHYESGTVNVKGYDMYEISPEVRRKEVLANILGYVPQASMNALVPVQKIRNFLFDVMKERGIDDETLKKIYALGKKASKKQIRDIVLEKAIKHFKSLGLDENVLDLYPHELSGGMKQRTTIAVSTLWKPALLIADEPTSALDVSTQKVLIEVFMDLIKKGYVETILFISHDIPTLRQICTRCIIMYAGRIVEDGTMDSIVYSPMHPYTKGLVASIVSFRPDGKEETQLVSIPGSPPDLRKQPKGCLFAPRCPKRMPICGKERPPYFFPKGENHPVSCWLYKPEDA